MKNDLISSSMKKEIEKNLGASTVKWNPSLKYMNTWKLDGQAFSLVEVESQESLSALISLFQREGWKYKIWGKGSNLLIPPVWSGHILRLGKDFKRFIISGSDAVIGAAASDAYAANYSVRNAKSGLEFLIGVPGTIGGAVAMNAGAHGQEMSDVVHSVTVMHQDGKVEIMTAEQLEFRYRSSKIGQTNSLVALEVRLKLLDEEVNLLKERLANIHQKRLATQPLKLPSCGSVFRNPEGLHAAALIEASGLKGMHCGGMQISPKHCNFIINASEGTKQQALQLIEMVQQRVWRDHHVELKPEVEVLN
jgi:UDP-N-acetylmuramate dehydrogenase